MHNTGVTTTPPVSETTGDPSPSQATASTTWLAEHAPLLAGIVIAVAAGGLYVRTLAPSVMPGDYAEFQMAAAVLGVPHPTGYPLYILLGKLFTFLPFGDIAYRVNLSSAIFMAGAAGTVYAITLRLLTALGARRWWWTAALGAVLFALSPTVWSMALVARSYALNALLVGSVVYALVSWRSTARTPWFVASCALIGLSLAHHGTNFLLLPAYGLFLLVVEIQRGSRRVDARPWPRRALGACAFLVGYGPILFLVYRFVWGSPYYWGNPTTWSDFFNLLHGGPFENQVFAFGWGAQFDRFIFGMNELSGQYSYAGIVLSLLGLAVLWRSMKPEAALLTLMVLPNFFFAMNYALVGYLYFIPTYLIFGVLAGVGLASLLRFALRALDRRLAWVASVSAAVVLAGICLLAGLAFTTRFTGIDQSGKTATRDAALALLNSAPPDASLYMDWEDVSVIRFYRLAYGLRTDLTLHTGDPADWAKGIYCDLARGAPAYVGKFAGAEPAVVARDFALTPAPMGWKVSSVVDAARYEVPVCGACATCR